MDKPKFVYVTYIKTSAEKLWAALTKPEFTKQYWFGIQFKTDWRVGSKFDASDDDKHLGISGKILEYDAPRRLSYGFIPMQAKPGMCEHDSPSRVVLELEPTGDHVKLTVTHDQFNEGSKLLESISTGWPLVLSGLKSLLETGEASNLMPPNCDKK
jgi:uncharacterized protein YndB with AHSA1/START domain